MAAGDSSFSAVASSFSSSRFVIRPCSSKTALRSDLESLDDAEEEISSSSVPIHGQDNEGIVDFEHFEGRRKGLVLSGTSSMAKGVNLLNHKRGRRKDRGLRLRRRRIRGPLLSGGERSGGNCVELAYPLGMSFAAIISQVVKGKSIKEGRIPAVHLSRICISSVKEAVENVFGERFECFLRSFEKSFDSTFKTLQIISKADADYGNLMDPPTTINHFEYPSSQGGAITQSFRGPEILSSQHIETQSSQVGPTGQEPMGETDQIQSHNHENNHLALLGDVNQQLAHISQSRGGLGYNRSIMSTFERSVVEQARSNDLKEFEIGLSLKHLQLKQSQLDLSFYANVLEKVKISMGFSKACFKEQKLKNKMQDVRHAELVRRCIDFLVAGLLIMSVCLGYGAWVYSYKRITEATSSCTTSKETKSWWVPKQMASFSSSWSLLRCHVVVLTRMTFGLLMILAIAYSLFQRSAGPMMPVTFILLVLGIICGAAGKLCIDTLGGSGYWWLLHWEAFCLLHFFVTTFPSVVHPHLYGPVTLQEGKAGGVVPYCVRRSLFYGILLLILPMYSGLIPFASVGDWRRHFIDMTLDTKEE